MKRNQAQNKRWKKLFKYHIFTARYTGAKKWVRDNTKAVCMTLEYPWFGRSVADMRLLGAKTIQSFGELVAYLT